MIVRSKPGSRQRKRVRRMAQTPVRRVDRRNRQVPAVYLQMPHHADVRRTIASPTRAGSADILSLQRMVGNRAVTRLIQASLTVNAAGDRYEQEADRVANQVTGMSRSGAWQSVQQQASVISPLLQRDG